MTHRFRPLAAVAACGLLALAGCESLQRSDSFLGVVTPYRVEIDAFAIAGKGSATHG